MTEWILGLIATACGGLNIFQLIWWRSEKRKLAAEADSATADAKQKEIDLQQDQYDYLLEKLSKYQQDYFALADKMQESTHTYLQTINAKCNEIAELKSKLIYFKGLRCYKSDCSMRIKCNPKDKENNGNAKEGQQG